MTSRAWFICGAALLVVLAAVPEFAGRTLPDTGWLLYAAGELLNGATLYVDLVEVNPPLIVWLNTIPVALARVASLSPILVYRVLVLALVACSIVVSGRLVERGAPEESDGWRRALVLLLLFGALTMAREDYGEREHLLLALALPFVLLTWLRADGVPMPGWKASAIGAAAGVGIALKPYFAPLWLALELYLYAAARPRRWRLRPESAAILAVGLAYVAAVVAWAPDYFDVVRLMAAPYHTFLSNSPAVTALLGDGASLPLIAGLAYLALRDRPRHASLWAVLTVAAAAMYLSAVLQQKGWRYHFYPSMAFSVALLGLMVIDRRPTAVTPVSKLFVGAATTILVFIPLWTAWDSVKEGLAPLAARYDADPDLGRLIPLVRRHAGGGTVTVFSWSIASAYPLVNYSGVRSGSRFNSMWPLAAVYRDATRSPEPIRYRERDHMGPLERYLGEAVVDDLARERPGLVLALRPGPDRPEWGLRRLDFIGYFLRDPRFKRLFSRYRYVGEVGEYWLFERLPEHAPPVRHPPRASQPAA